MGSVLAITMISVDDWRSKVAPADCLPDTVPSSSAEWNGPSSWFQSSVFLGASSDVGSEINDVGLPSHLDADQTYFFGPITRQRHSQMTATQEVRLPWTVPPAESQSLNDRCLWPRAHIVAWC